MNITNKHRDQCSLTVLHQQSHKVTARNVKSNCGGHQIFIIRKFYSQFGLVSKQTVVLQVVCISQNDIRLRNREKERERESEREIEREIAACLNSCCSHLCQTPACCSGTHTLTHTRTYLSLHPQPG